MRLERRFFVRAMVFRARFRKHIFSAFLFFFCYLLLPPFTPFGREEEEEERLGPDNKTRFTFHNANQKTNQTQITNGTDVPDDLLGRRHLRLPGWG